MFKRAVVILSALLLLTATPATAAWNNRQGATATAVASGTGDAQAVTAASDLRLVGFSCRENAGTPAAAEFIIRNGTSASDPAVVFVKLAASESVRDQFGDQGLACPDGIYIDRVSGTSEITVYTRQ